MKNAEEENQAANPTPAGVMGRDGVWQEGAEGNDPSLKGSSNFPTLVLRLPSAYGFIIYNQEKDRKVSTWQAEMQNFN